MTGPGWREAERGRPRSEPDAAGREHRRARPAVERVGIGFIAILIAALFGAIGAVSWAGDEPFLAVMSWSGALMTVWAAGSTIRER